MGKSLARRQRTSPSALRNRRRVGLERLEARHMMSAMPLGATDQDTGEFLLGRVAVVPVLFESNGATDANTENWTPAEIDAAISKVRDGVQWWSDALDTLGTVHSLEFVIDESFARNPFPTPYEPINRTSQDSPLYITPFLRAQGIDQASSLEDAVRQFNHATRERLNTDWAFTIFLIDSSNDSDSSFAPGSEFNTAFAYAGGLYVVSPSTRPTSTITHETGHIFWARDEYPGGGSWTDRRGYYDAQNLNAADNPTPGFVQEPSVMRSGTALTTAYNTYALPESTRAMLGWRDSDGDGIFDLADVPLHLEGDGSYDAAEGVFRFAGHARAVPLANQNSSGPGNDITLNRVDRIEYRIDGGPWQTATSVDSQAADLQFELPLQPFETIQLRAIDVAVGVTSPVLQATGLGPLLSENSIGGYAFVGAGGEGEIDPSQALLANVTATLTRPDGSPLLQGTVEADDYAPGTLPSSVGGATLSTAGAVLDGRVNSFASAASGGMASLHYYNLQSAKWQSGWAPDRKLAVQFAEPVGRVQLDAVGISTAGSYARLEAYDADGNLLSRVTTDRLSVGENTTMQVDDAHGRIASILAYGHQASEVALDALVFGVDTTVTTDQNGRFRFNGFADGNYRLALAPDRLIYRFPESSVLVTVADGLLGPVAASFERVASPWRNPLDRFDIDGNGSVQPLDALRIINDLSRHGIRVLTDPAQRTHFFDPSDDGAITPLDALRVINELSRRRRADSEGEAGPAGIDRVLAAWPGDLDDEKPQQDPEDLSYSLEPIV